MNKRCGSYEGRHRKQHILNRREIGKCLEVVNRIKTIMLNCGNFPRKFCETEKKWNYIEVEVEVTVSEISQVYFQMNDF